MCLTERSIVNKKNELNIMVEYIDPDINESWANKDASYVSLELTGYVMLMRDRIGRRGGELFYILKNLFRHTKKQLEREADCDEASWCKIV